MERKAGPGRGGRPSGGGAWAKSTSRQGRPQRDLPRARRSQPQGLPGLDARRLAVDVLLGILERKRPFDEQFDRIAAEPRFAALAPRDRAHAHLIVATALRRYGQIAEMLGHFIERPLPADAAAVRAGLVTAAAQLLFLETPAHAAIDLAVTLCRGLHNGGRYAGLTNAVLRKVAREGADLIAKQDVARLVIPPWLFERWCAAYGEPSVRRIAAPLRGGPPLHLTVRRDPPGWAERLGGRLLPTGTVRLLHKGRVDTLLGYGGGAWWVQDAAAALPARLLRAGPGMRVADLCAAPGGKTAQLCASGAQVTAVDSSAVRIDRLRRNMQRLGMAPSVIEADVLTWVPKHGMHFDAVLLDAPCLATGTARRNPDVLLLKTPAQLEELTALQARLIDKAVALMRPGGVLVYCTCSLEPEEGPSQIAEALRRHAGLRVERIEADEVSGAGEWITPEGYLRTLPCHLDMGAPEWSGMDGFFAARLRKLKL
jgi:16S rRNA (cytosine967-C5)-methyltransferase